MTILLILITLLCVILTAAVVGYLVVQIRRDKQRSNSEVAAAEAARKYLEKFGIPCRISATRMEEGMVLLVETEPHKKLRFSYIIEQPMRKFVSEVAGIWVHSIFWRFRVNQKHLSVPEVKYPNADTQAPSISSTSQVVSATENTAVDSESKSEEKNREEIESDDYFRTSQQIQLEEASWDDFEDLLQTEFPSKKSEQDTES